MEAGCQPAAREAAQRVAFLTLGQTPRSDMLPEILNHLDADIEAVEYGLLDGVTPAEMHALAPGPGDHSLITRLRDGSDVVVSKAWIRERIAEVCGTVLDDRVDLVVLLSTGLIASVRPLCATLSSERVVDRTIEALISAGQSIGMVVPLREHIEEVVRETAKDTGVPGAVTGAVALPGDRAALLAAVEALDDKDIIILHSISYGEADRALVMAASGKPVVLARRAVAGSLGTLLQRLGDDGGDETGETLAARLRRLSRREREIMLLMADGLSNKVIGRRLGISHRTVEIHRSRVMDKLATETLPDLLRTAACIGRI